MEYQNKIEKIVTWIKQTLNDAHANGFVYGVSGGIDSALICAIASKYFKNNSLALRMDIYNCEKDINDANHVIKHFNVKSEIVNLEKNFELFKNQFPHHELALMNLKSRLRMNVLYYYAQLNNYLVCGTSNACELYTGYFTKYGDSGSDFMPLANLTKQDIYECAKILDVPINIIEKAPSAGLKENQKDEDDLKVTYKTIDDFLSGKTIPTIAKERIEYLHKLSEHKRNMSKTILPLGKILK